MGHASRGQTYGNGGIHLNLGARSDRQLRADGSRVAQPHYLRQLRRPGRNRGLSPTPVDEQATAAPASTCPGGEEWTLKGMEALTGEPMCPPIYLADKQVDPMGIPDRRGCCAT